MIGWLIKQNPATRYIQVYLNEVKRKVENKFLCKHVIEKNRWVILISDKMLFKAKSKKWTHRQYL